MSNALFTYRLRAFGLMESLVAIVFSSHGDNLPVFPLRNPLSLYRFRSCILSLRSIFFVLGPTRPNTQKTFPRLRKHFLSIILFGKSMIFPKSGTVRLRAFGLMESLVAIVLIALVATIFTTSFVSVNRSKIQTTANLSADQILLDTVEVLRSIRDQNYLFLVNGVHGLQFTSNTWSFNGSSDLVDGTYTRTVTIGDVYRDGSGDIDLVSGSFDARTKLVNIDISWASDVEGAQSVASQYTIADSFAFDHITTSLGEWDAGTHVDTVATESLLLDVQGISGAWTNSVNNVAYAFAGNENGDTYGVYVENNIAYLVGQRNGNTSPLRLIDVTDPLSVFVLGKIDFGDHSRDVVAEGNYVYLVTDDSSGELKVIDVSNPAVPVVDNVVDLGGSARGYSIAKEGNKLYVGLDDNTGAEFFVVDITTPTAPSILGSFELGYDVNDIEVNSDIAYLGLENPSGAMVILDVSNPASIFSLSQTNVNNSEALGIAYKSGNVFIGTRADSSGEEFRIYDVSNPSSPGQIGAIEINFHVNDVEVYNGYAFVSTEKHEVSYQVIDVTTPSSPVVEEVVDLATKANGMFANDDAVYVTADHNGTPFFIFTYPQPGFVTSGTYTSETFDTGSDDTVWHSFFWDGILNATTTVDYQIRTADTEANLSSADWVGPDGTNGTTFTAYETVITVAPAASGTRWVQYQAVLNGDGVFTPEIYSVRYQYSP